MSRLKYAVVRDRYLNPWDAGNYYGLAFRDDVELYYVGRSEVDWAPIVTLYPQAKTVSYDNTWDVMDYEFDIIDLPDPHYGFTRYFTERHDKCVIVGWDNLPGKNLDEGSKQALNRAWRIFARSNQAVHTLLFIDQIDPEKVYWVSGAVDTSFFKPPANNDDRSGILYVGRIVPEKGLHTLIWAMAGLETPLRIVGNISNSDYEMYCNDWAARLKVKLEYLGPVYDREHLATLYREAVAFVLPSQPKFSMDPYAAWSEQFGQVVIEALASGTPVIGSRCGAIPEVLDGIGFVFDPMDHSMLHYFLKGCLSLQDYDLFSTQAREKAIERYDIHKVASDIMEVINAS